MGPLEEWVRKLSALILRHSDYIVVDSFTKVDGGLKRATDPDENS